MLEEKVHEVEISKVLPDPDNLKRHDEVNLSQIRASISRFGFLDPIGVVDHPDKKGSFLVVEGHGRLTAAQALGMKSVPVIKLTLGDLERKGYAIAHNQIQRVTTMDLGAVATEFQRLGVESEDYASLGFSEEDALFLPFGAGDALPARSLSDTSEAEGDEVDTEDGPQFDASGQNTASWKGFIPTVYRTELQFSNEISYQRFVELLGILRGKFPSEPSISGRISAMVKEMGFNGEKTDGADV